MVVENLLTLPDHPGQAIIEAGAVIACPLLGTDGFIQFCNKRGLSINRERLIRFERLGLFAPVFRVRTPNQNSQPFYIPIRQENNWFIKKWAWDTTDTNRCCEVPDHRDQTQEGYYSIFQIDHLDFLLRAMTLTVQLDSYLDRNEGESIDWKKNGKRWIQHAEKTKESLRTHEYRRSVALLCQYISNRYFPQTQSDQRTIRLSSGHYSDCWISVYGHDWSWDEEVRRWEPKTAECLFNLKPNKLRHAYQTLASDQACCDPLEHWYPLTQFVALEHRNKLKGDALRAETLRAGAYMLRFLHKDLYGEELPHPYESTRKINIHIPELSIRQDARRYLEFVVNDFGINPQPRLSLFVEGQSEEIAVQKIFEKYFGVHSGKFGIEIIVLGGVDKATGNKQDRFRAILRLIDYLHHHQTITFLILDNENYAKKLKQETQKAKSIHSNQRYVTRPEYIRIWKNTFEFDNFSCNEIALAMNKLAQSYATFTDAEVVTCKKNPNPVTSLEHLYYQKTQYDLQKVKMSEILVENMLSPKTRRKIENRPIIKALNRVIRLATRNSFPITNEIWEKNQASKYLGKKRKPDRRRKLV